jgi:DNA-binding MarR family transcriptional regulator
VRDHVDRILEEADAHGSDSRSVEVLSRLYRVIQFVERRLGEAYRKANLNRGEVDVLYALLRSSDEPLSASQISSMLLCSSGAMTNRLDRLEKAGHVKRRHGTSDRRSVLVTITPSGRDAVHKASAAREAAIDKILPELTKADRRALVGILRKMLIAFEASGET